MPKAIYESQIESDPGQYREDPNKQNDAENDLALGGDEFSVNVILHILQRPDIVEHDQRTKEEEEDFR